MQDPIVERAIRDAERAASAAGVRVRELDDVDAQAQAIALLADIWGRAPENPVVPPELLRALGKAGGYVGGAFAGAELVGVGIAFHGDPDRRALHSHVTGVASGMIGRSVGFALKQHQRAWALSRRLDVIEWTFDPLVARNARFNIEKLGAEPTEYLTNFYGEIRDGVNGGDETDRLLVTWRLRDETVVERAGAPTPTPRREDDVCVPVPSGIAHIRREDPSAARAWREQVRERLAALMGSGHRIVGFDRADGYVLRREERP
ncbi:GNAT family N-acetyltransferase [Microbacterium paludicola]|uniref:GNAT family N-acetyltransferase n=1 Tax=Microbacterium paludicola TaxID=300019 RepID=UPI0011A74822|nr:GNAT family N-acetyltransferase [Microbacterium paludicola]